MSPTAFWICIIFAGFCGVLLGAFIMAAVNLASNADDQMEAFKDKEAEQRRNNPFDHQSIGSVAALEAEHHHAQ